MRLGVNYLGTTEHLVNIIIENCSRKHFFSGFEDCSNIDQFDKIENLYMNLSKKDKFYIVNSTGCLYPCNYLEYRVGSKRTTNVGQFGLWITFGSVATTVEKEFYSYQFDSLVSDYGGSLGLFIGFSFFALWDIVKDLVILAFQAGK